MATPLLQYWTDEVARLATSTTAQRAEVHAQRGALTAARTLQQTAADSVRSQALAVEAARKALAGIPMPADGNPLLAAMETALIALAEAQATLAAQALAVQVQTAELTRLETRLAITEEALAEARREEKQADVESKARQKLIDALLTGELATLSADAAAAVAASEATARARVEGEFPSNATAAKSFLKRVRERRDLVRESVRLAGEVDTAAFNAVNAVVLQAQRRFLRAAQALRSTADAAPRLEADAKTLQRFAALPAPTATTFPFLSRWQHERLHDPTRKTARENALAKLAAVDAAVAAVRPAQQAYDTALHAAMKAEPDKTRAELDAGPVATERGTLTTKIAAVGTARAAMSDAELDTVKAWFAAVPEGLWEALEKFDTAASRLAALSGAASPANVMAELAAAETAYATALGADRLATRKLLGAALALERAAALEEAERETVGSRANAYAHSAALF